ncbi:hypothetical protein GFK82_00382 [Candidatus Steffania adelgidicola]|nr:hypothetical protein GFK82_00382 [Candidatus Steffania adelgidicola]
MIIRIHTYLNPFINRENVITLQISALYSLYLMHIYLCIFYISIMGSIPI